MSYKKQTVIIETEEGTAPDRETLIRIWEERLKKIAPHYKIKSVEIEE